MSDVRLLLETVLASPGNKELLDEVRARATEIIEHLDEMGSLADWEQPVFKNHPEWVAEVLAAIAGEDELSTEDEETIEALFEANASDESAVGYAFKEGLLQGLPEHLADLGGWLKSVPPISKDEWEELLQTPAVQAALPPAERLAPFGVSPLTVFYATEAISGLTERLAARHLGFLHTPIILDPSALPARARFGFVLPSDAVLREIQQMAECSRALADVLYPWLTAVAQFKPFVFRHFQASPVETAVRLTRIPTEHHDLYVRWGLLAETRDEVGASA